MEKKTQTKVVSNNTKKVSSTKTIKTENKSLTTSGANQKTIRVVKIVGISLIFAALLFMFIGWFGDALGVRLHEESGGIIQNTYKGYGALDFFFKDGWELFKHTLPLKSMDVIRKMTFILYFLSYIVMMIAIIVSAVFAILKGVKFLTKKDQNVKLNLFVNIALIAALAYAVIGAFAYYGGGREESLTGPKTIETSVEIFGWGSALVIVGACVMVIASTLFQYNGEKGKVLAKFITRKAPLLVMVFVMAFGFAAAYWFSWKTDTSIEITHTNAWGYLGSLEFNNSWGILMCMTIIIMVAMMVIAFMMFTLNDTKKLIIFAGVFLGLTLLAIILSSVGLYKLIDFIPGTGEKSSNIGWSFLLDFGLGIMVLASVIVSHKLTIGKKPVKQAKVAKAAA